MSRIAQPPATEISSKKRHWKLWLILVFLVLPVLLFALYTWATLHYAYSIVERAGCVQKISQKGWICKTWEGELAMTTVPGTAPQIWQFTVRGDATAHQIEQTAGQRVALSYQQHRGVPSSCFGETEYFRHWSTQGRPLEKNLHTAWDNNFPVFTAAHAAVESEGVQIALCRSSAPGASSPTPTKRL